MARLLVNKELRVLIKDLQGLGYTVRRDGGQHLKVYTQAGACIYSLPNSPGRGRWRQNLLADIRKLSA